MCMLQWAVRTVPRRGCREGEWTEVEVPLERFLQTWKGRLVDSEDAMNPGRIVGMGISVAGAGEREDDGSFQLDLDWIRARRLHASF
jgi:NADH dehydrogenase [ubiquinone] 1 alpha subcomplex assembly factor 1